MMLIYLFIINALGLAVMLLDKLLAKKKLWRVPESTLFAVAIIGGSLGSLVGMYLVRHKTMHIEFVLGLPAILIAHIVLFLLIR